MRDALLILGGFMSGILFGFGVGYWNCLRR